MTSAHTSVWLTGEGHRSPSFTGDLRSDVSIVGPGITSVSSALLLQRAGLDVAVIDMHASVAGPPATPPAGCHDGTASPTQRTRDRGSERRPTGRRPSDEDQAA